MEMEKNKNLITYEDLIKLLKTYMSLDDLKLIDKYYEEAKDVFKDMKRETGEDYIYHPIAVAYTLAELKMDPVTIGSALIHEAITLEKRTYEEIEEKFGEETAIILECITKISHLKRTFNGCLIIYFVSYLISFIGAKISFNTRLKYLFI